MSQATLAVRAAAPRRLKVKSGPANLPDHKGVPDTFPAEESIEYRDVKSGDVPKFVWWASFSSEYARSIPAAEFRRLSRAQRQFVIDSLASRGEMLYERRGRLAVIPIEDDGTALQLHPQIREFELGISDARLEHRNDVTFLVWNADSLKDAQQKVQDFLRDIVAVGVDLEAVR